MEKEVLRVFKRKDLKQVPESFNSIWGRLSAKERFYFPREASYEPEEFFNSLKSKLDTYSFCSFFIAVEPIEWPLYRRKSYSKIKRSKIVSMIEEYARRYWMERQGEFHGKIDKRCKGLVGEQLDGCIDEITREAYPMAKEKIKGEFQEIYEKRWRKKFKKTDIYRERWKFYYTRRFEMPKPFCYWDERDSWAQYFVIEEDSGIWWRRGGSSSSGARADHQLYGTLFSKIQDIKTIPTYIFWYDRRNRFWWVDTWQEFVVCPHELMWSRYSDKESALKKVKKITEHLWGIDGNNGYIEVFKDVP